MELFLPKVGPLEVMQSLCLAFCWIVLHSRKSSMFISLFVHVCAALPPVNACHKHSHTGVFACVHVVGNRLPHSPPWPLAPLCVAWRCCAKHCNCHSNCMLQVEIVSALDHANELYIVVAGGWPVPQYCLQCRSAGGTTVLQLKAASNTAVLCMGLSLQNKHLLSITALCQKILLEVLQHC
jgi:hypothetical protein